MFPFDNFPFTNFHRLNADWILQVVKDMADKVEKVKDAYSPQQPPPYPVTSVNGKTGAVITPFVQDGTEPIKMFDKVSGADYWGLVRRLNDGRTVELWVKPDGHISLVTRSASGSLERNVQLVNNTEIPQTGVYSVNGKAGVVYLEAAEIGAVDTSDIVQSTAVDDTTKVPSAAVTHALQERMQASERVSIAISSPYFSNVRMSYGFRAGYVGIIDIWARFDPNNRPPANSSFAIGTLPASIKPKYSTQAFGANVDINSARIGDATGGCLVEINASGAITVSVGAHPENLTAILAHVAYDLEA